MVKNEKREKRRRSFGYETEGKFGGAGEEVRMIGGNNNNDNVGMGNDSSGNIGSNNFDPAASGLAMTQSQQNSAFGSQTTTQSQFQYHIPTRQALHFNSISAATEAVKDAGEVVSSLLHALVVNLDTLDDAMDDWDQSPGEEIGEDVEGLEDESEEGGGMWS